MSLCCLKNNFGFNNVNLIVLCIRYKRLEVLSAFTNAVSVSCFLMI